MAPLKNTALRVEEDQLRLADEVTEAMKRSPDFRGAGLTRSVVLRMALARGLDALQQQYRAGRPRTGERTKGRRGDHDRI